MKRLLGGLTAAALLGVFATAQEPAKEAPAAAAPRPGAPFFEKFDLNKDGKVDWEEYQKVRSGFAAFDENNDGVITDADFAKIMERNMQRMQQAMQRRMMQRMDRGGPGMGGRGFGPLSREREGASEGDMGPRDGPGMRPRMQRGPDGPGGGGQGMPPRRGRGQQRGGGTWWGSGDPGPDGDGPPPEGQRPAPPPPR